MERERAQYLAQTIGNALLVVAGVIFVVGAICVGIVVEDTVPLFSPDPFDDSSLTDYLRASINYVLILLMTVAVLAVGGLFFRWLAVEQDARMSEFELLLDALGVPFEGEAEAEDAPPEPAPDA